MKHNLISSLFAVAFGVLWMLSGSTAEVDVKGRVVVCVALVNTPSWQAFPLEDEKALPSAALSTVWGKQSILVADKFVGSVGAAGPVKFAFFKREFTGAEDRKGFVSEMKKRQASSVGFLTLTLDAPVVERGVFTVVTQRISYKLTGENGRVWTAGTVREKATGKMQAGDALLVDAVDAAVASLARQLTMKMQP